MGVCVVSGALWSREGPPPQIRDVAVLWLLLSAAPRGSSVRFGVAWRGAGRREVAAGPVRGMGRPLCSPGSLLPSRGGPPRDVSGANRGGTCRWGVGRGFLSSCCGFAETTRPGHVGRRLGLKRGEQEALQGWGARGPISWKPKYQMGKWGLPVCLPAWTPFSLQRHSPLLLGPCSGTVCTWWERSSACQEARIGGHVPEGSAQEPEKLKKENSLPRCLCLLSTPGRSSTLHAKRDGSHVNARASAQEAQGRVGGPGVA